MNQRACIALAAGMLFAGLAIGFILSNLIDYRVSLTSVSTSAARSAVSSTDADNTELLALSADILSALKTEDWSTLSTYVDTERGVTFTPQSTVDFTTDLTFSADALKTAAQDSTTYVWGVSSGTNEPIRMTITDYFQTYVWDQDYSAASEIGLDTVIHTGNAVENVASAYEDCRFLDFYFPGSEESGEDWSALKLVFTWSNQQWYLVGIVHSEWTL